MPAKDSRSLAQSLVLPFLLVVVALIFFVMRDHLQEIVDPSSQPSNSQVQIEADALKDVAGLERPTTVPIDLQREELRDAEGQPLTAEALAQRVLVRAELTTVYAEQGHAPKNCDGWLVTAQSWDEKTGDKERFTAIANRYGVAEFQFPDFVHIDWVRCEPPIDSGFGIAYVEDHEDIPAGDNYLALLHVMPKRSAFGHVVDWNNCPVAGVEIHAFGDFGDNGLEEWTPGLATTTTDGNGRFEFHQLATGGWYFGVVPERWMMIDPKLSDQDEGGGYVFIDEDVPGSADAGIMRVMPMTTVELTVVDRRGEPAAGVDGDLSAQAYDSPRLYAPRLYPPRVDWDNDGIVENDRFRCPHDDLDFITDKDGVAILRVAPGLWKIDIDFFRGNFPGIYKLPNLEFHSSVGRLRYELPMSVTSFSARFVFADQRPASGTLVTLAYEEEGFTSRLHDQCGADGRFFFSDLDVDTAYTLHAYPELDGSAAMFFPQTWTINPAADAGRDFVVEKADQTKVRLTRIDGDQSFQRIKARLVLTNWDAANGSIGPADGTWWEEAEIWSEEVLPERAVKLPPVPEGFATVELRLPQPTGSWNKYGYANVRLETIQTWRIAIDGGTVNLDADLQGYEAPPGHFTQHTGVVVNAESEEAITNALIVFYCAQGSIKTRVTSAKGFNFYSVADIGTIHVSAPGHVTLVVPEYAYKPGKHEHRFVLEPNSPTFELLILDRLGALAEPQRLELLGERSEKLLVLPPPPEPLPGMEVFGNQYGSPAMPVTPMPTNVFPSHHESAHMIPGLRPGRIKAVAYFAEGVRAEGWFTAPVESNSMVEVRLNKSQAEINQEIIALAESKQK